VGPGWALVGDAGYFKDPFTAHGITDALRDAELLAQAIVRGSAGAMAAYRDTRDTLSCDLFEVTDRIASCQWEMSELSSLHRALSRAMSLEVEHIVMRFTPPETWDGARASDLSPLEVAPPHPTGRISAADRSYLSAVATNAR